MPVSLTSVVFQAEDPAALAENWAMHFEEWRIRDREAEEIHLVPDQDGPLDLVFARAEPRAKAGKNRIHLDLNTWDMRGYTGAAEALRQLGVPEVDLGQGDAMPWTVFADREGNEYCLLQPRPRYSDAGELAAVVVDCADPE